MQVSSCTKCGEAKSEDAFYVRRSGKRAGTRYTRCKDCYKQRGRTYYHTNHKPQKDKIQARRKLTTKYKRAITLLLRDKPCGDCNKRFEPWLMEFDHVSGSKVADISQMCFGGSFSVKRILEETAKCEVLCVYCHRKRTFEHLWGDNLKATLEILENEREFLLEVMSNPEHFYRRFSPGRKR